MGKEKLRVPVCSWLLLTHFLHRISTVGTGLRTVGAIKSVAVYVMSAVLWNQTPTRLADAQFFTFPASRRIAAPVGSAAADAAWCASNVQMPIVSIALHQRQRGVAILIICIMQAALRGRPIRPDFCKGRIRFPEIRQSKTSCNDTLHDAPIQLPYIIVVLRIQPRLQQHTITIAEDLSGQPPRTIKVILDLIIDCEEYHAHAVAHIRLAAGLPSAVS